MVQAKRTEGASSWLKQPCRRVHCCRHERSKQPPHPWHISRQLGQGGPAGCRQGPQATAECELVT